MFRIFILSLTVLLVSCGTHESVNQRTTFSNCSVTNVQLGQDITLNSIDAAPRIYLIQNKSNQTFWLNHVTHRPMNAGWASSISPDHWSAILVDEPAFALSCSTVTGPQNQRLNCADVTNVCLLSTKPIKAGDHYWVTEDRMGADILSAIQQRGF